MGCDENQVRDVLHDAVSKAANPLKK